MHDPLFQPVRLGAIEAPNRIIMAPLTRGRATSEGVPTPIMIEYYRQRASAGLIITEATGISREGLGWPSAPGIWNDEQTEAWKPIVEAVHQAGGRIVLQMWHMGRIVHPDFLGGQPPVSASATRAPGQAHTPTGKQDFATARPLTLDEMPRLIDDYGRAAENAKKAGFDGVQLHAANGYLIDQFLRDGTNLRDDEYGGSPQNRVRLMREVVERLISVWGKERVSIRLSPNGDSQGVDDSNPAATFGEAARVLQEVGVSFVELRQPGPEGTFGQTDVPQQDSVIRAIYTGPLVLNSDYTPEQAAADVASGRTDAISFGRPFISNPDLVDRIQKGAHINPNKGVPQTWYFPGEVGYTDYPTLAEETAAA
ncbi:MAG: alkene reductase [Novosphingobium sp. 17-62-19]|uniref:alkene reductase n=1 Tax=Novosphingobium sp. 17-62-19 TaxID=1970406 RepID=UPI000BDDDFF6|nr:alkene reductase [Novosphingobium sp. 17-62-19]OYX95769.1 MAG: alkene reductase [Novosphingobium sp. 35-62-5]OZA19211.1 MAG: alkene reductase [Novosphingobium sp. 17-62-19]HQS96067.1 alkene reductase [Novosphingobium sp.]